MRLTIFILLATTILFFSACKETNEDPKGTLEIVFKAQYNDSPLVLYQDYNTNETDPTKIQLSILQFFLADVMSQKDQTDVNLLDVEQINFLNTIDLANAEAGVAVTINDLAVGNYSGLYFGVGLSDDVNTNTSPSDYSTDSPLGVNGNYWATWNSYIYSRLEGTITKADSSQSQFLYHSGGNGMQQNLSFNKDFSIAADQTTTLTVHINVEDIFFKTGDEIDLINNNASHSGGVGTPEYNLALKSVENLAGAMVMQ